MHRVIMLRFILASPFTVCAAAAAASYASSSFVRLNSRILSPTQITGLTTMLRSSVTTTSPDSASPNMISPRVSFREKLELPPTPSSTTLPPPLSTSRQHRRPLVIGHRGSLYQAVENTRQSFQFCMDMGCDGFELDVYVIADGTLIVFHGNDSPGLRLGDFSEYCVTPVEGTAAALATSIVDLTYEECQQQLRFNPDFDEFACPKDLIATSRIPTLEEILTDVQEHNNRNHHHHKMIVKIELKGPNTVLPVLELVERLDMVKDCCYSSFDLSQLNQLRQLRPSREQYPTGALFADLPNDYLQQALEVGATEIHLRYDDCTPSRIAEIHRHGLGTMAWMRGPRGMQSDASFKYTDVGNEDERMYQTMLETGVQRLCVNKPDLLLEVLRRHSSTSHSSSTNEEEADN